MPTTEGRDALALEIFGTRWLAIATKSGAGRARNKMRQQAEKERDLRALKATGARCGNCRSFERMPGVGRKGMRCAAESDFYGDTVAHADGLCLLWSARALAGEKTDV